MLSETRVEGAHLDGQPVYHLASPLLHYHVQQSDAQMVPNATVSITATGK